MASVYGSGGAAALPLEKIDSYLPLKVAHPILGELTVSRFGYEDEGEERTWPTKALIKSGRCLCYGSQNAERRD